MLIEILGETLEFPNETEAVPEILRATDQRLSLAGVYYSHSCIDGVECYDGLDMFLRDNIADTERINITGVTLKDLTDAILLSAFEYLTGAIPALTDLAPKFYQESLADCWQQLVELLEGVEWLLDSFALIDRKIAMSPCVESYPNWDEYLGNIYSLKEMVKKLGQAVESKDTVLVGDILNNELIDLFTRTKETLNNMLPWEA